MGTYVLAGIYRCAPAVIPLAPGLERPIHQGRLFCLNVDSTPGFSKPIEKLHRLSWPSPGSLQRHLVGKNRNLPTLHPLPGGNPRWSAEQTIRYVEGKFLLQWVATPTFSCPYGRTTPPQKRGPPCFNFCVSSMEKVDSLGQRPASPTSQHQPGKAPPLWGALRLLFRPLFALVSR